MSGTITVTTSSDWFTPYGVEVKADDGAVQATARFMAASRAQEYALAKADATGFTLVYRDLREPGQSANDLEGSTNGDLPKTSASTEDFQRRFQRICSKCRVAKPLVEFDAVMARSRTTGKQVFHGYAERCRDCEAAA